MRKSTKIAVVLAAAALLVAGFAFTTLAKGWVKEGEGLYYYEDEYGMKVYNEWKKDGANYYYLGDDGYMVTDTLVEFDGNKYWCGADGAKVVSQWIKVPADQEDIDTYEVEYRWFYFDKNGKAYKNVKKDIDGKTYFFDAEGKMQYGFVDYDGTTVNGMVTSVSKAYDGANYLYYCGSNEEGWALKSEWRNETNVSDYYAYEDESTWWAFYQSNGKRAVAKAEGYLWKGQRYYFDANGKMLTGWKKATDSDDATQSVYYGGADDGKKVKKAWAYVENKEVEEDKKHWFYFDNAGFALSSADGCVAKINGKFYAFNAVADKKIASKMLSGTVILKGSFDVITDATGTEAIDLSKRTLKDWLENGNGTVYYFSGDEANDGSLKKNVTFSQEFLDDTYTLAVGSDGKLKNGYVTKEKKYYRFGYLLAASEDARYEVKDVYFDASKFALLGVSGAEVTSGTVADADGSYYYVTKATDDAPSVIYKADSSQLSPAKMVSAFKNNGAKKNTEVKIEDVNYYIWVEAKTGYKALTLHKTAQE